MSINIGTQVQILIEAFSISQSIKIIEKGMHPTILPPVMDK